jgi:hypothetical protein
MLSPKKSSQKVNPPSQIETDVQNEAPLEKYRSVTNLQVAKGTERLEVKVLV